MQPRTTSTETFIYIIHNADVHQQSLYTEKKIHHLEQKNARMTESCRQKLGELHTAYASAKRKYEEVRTQKQMLEADNRELQDKYAQKAM